MSESSFKLTGEETLNDNFMFDIDMPVPWQTWDILLIINTNAG